MKVGLIYPHKDFRKDVDFHPNLTPGDADNNLDYLEVVHVFIRRPYSSRQALHQVREKDRTDHSTKH